MELEKLEFRDKIQSALKTLKQFQNPSYGKAIIQLANSFGPYIVLWILMYNLWEYSKLAVCISVGHTQRIFSLYVFSSSSTIAGHNSFCKIPLHA